ncbi:MAG TPA: hypothetical protein DCP90_04360 [Clostridiales bacterium]|nr:MAG: NADH dehydrogenase [Clostridiales bacterium GWD2_32_59]HAN09828.1 hypothetical protein [Clostridiales bacterium]
MLESFYNIMMTDWLSIFFVALIILISIPICLFSIGYVKEYRQNYSIKYIYSMMTFFILSMIGVVFSNNSIVFMIFWEIMSMTSFFLVIYEYKNKENLSSGIMYFVMTHISGLVLMIMFALIYKYTNSFDFKEIMEYSNKFTLTQKTIIFILAIIGFGAKAGLMPLHAWLPKAHPSAPSNVSALMSGVMLKVAVYGFIRTAFMFLGDVPYSYGISLMIIGTLTAIISILNASAQRNMKKLLAYSSAENIGLIFSVLGLAIIFKSYGLNTLAVLALTAGLFHAVNHGIFKSLLFTAAGSVLYSTGTKNMNELGGLYKKMKFATFCAFVGTAAISAIPPLNGFASEVAIFMSFIQVAGKIDSIWMIVIILCGSILALTSGAVMYVSVKSFGITYLGEPRSIKAQNIHKVPISMNIGMGLLSVYAILFGVLSKFIFEYIIKISQDIINVGNIRLDENTLQNFVGFDIVVMASIIISVTVVFLLVNYITRKNKTFKVYDTWGCGFNEAKPYMQYSGSGFTQPLSKIATSIIGYKKTVLKEETIFFRQHTTDMIEKYLYNPIISLVDYLAIKITKIHYGQIQVYIAYIIMSLIIAVVCVVKFI